MSNLIDILHKYGNMYGDSNPMATDITPKQPIVKSQIPATTLVKKPQTSVNITPTTITTSEVTPKVNFGEFTLTDPSVSTFYSLKPQLSNTKVSNDAGYRNNNPGNLVGSDGKFRRFDSLEDGYKALQNDLNIKLSGKSKYIAPTGTVKDFIYVYAPPSENNTANYLNFITKSTGIAPTTKLDQLSVEQRQSLLKNIVKIESPNSYAYLFDKNAYKSAMSNLNPQHVKKGGGILYNKKQK